MTFRQRFELWAHLVSDHAGIYSPDLTPAELTDIHDHEHRGPGTIRDHDPRQRTYSLKKMGEVLSESDDFE